MIRNSLPVPLNVGSDYAVTIDRVLQKVQTPLPVPHSTRSFWFTSSDVRPTPTEGSEGPLTETADICIIGSGITGVSAAYHLAKGLSQRSELTGGRPVRAVILEAREFCSGATGRNGGHLTAHPFSGFLGLEKEFGTEDALRAIDIENYTTSEILRILKENDLEEYVDWVPGGRLMLYFSEQEFGRERADYEGAKNAGAPVDMVQWLSKEGTLEKYGAPYPATVIPGNNLWPLKLVAQLFNLANKIGSASQPHTTFAVSLHTKTPVTGISPLSPGISVEGNRVISAGISLPPHRYTLTTPRGDIKCSYIIHATNGYVSHLLPHTRVVPTRGQIIALRSNVSEDKLTKIAGTANDGFEYWFPRPIKRSPSGEPLENPLVILGGAREVSSKPFELDEADDSVTDPRVGKALREFLPKVFPGYYEEGREPEMEWTGIMGFTKSGDPFVGPVVNPSDPEDSTYKGQYVSAGYTGHGMPRAFACAQVVADMILADLEGKEWSPPDWLPRHYLTKAAP